MTPLPVQRIPTAVRIFLLAAIFILMGELCTRLFSPEGHITPAILGARTFQSVPAVFSRSVLPQKEQTVKVGKNVFARINSKGYRGPEFSVKKPEGVTRIIIYGESAVFDITASEGNDWPHLVEQELKKRGFPKVEVINAGALGHASFDSFGKFFAEGHLFDPDYVILYNGWNDMKFFAGDEPLLRRVKPSVEPFLYQYQGKLDQFLCEFSQLYVRLRYRYIMWRYRVGEEGVKPSEHSSRISEVALRQYRLTLETFVDMVRNAGAVPVLTLQTHLVKEENTPEEKAMINYDSQTLTHEALVKATALIEQITREVAAEKKAPLLDASTRLSGSLTYLRDHIHPTPAGSRKLAELTSELLEKLMRSRAAETAERETPDKD